MPTFRFKNLTLSKFTFAAYVVIVTATALISYYAVLDYSANQTLSPFTVISLILAITTLVFLIWFLLKEKGSPEKLFLTVAFPGCFAFALFLLPNQVPDEIWHIYRIFDIFNDGNSMVVVSVLDIEQIPKDYAEMWRVLQQPANYSDTIFVDRLFATYSPVLYVIPGLFVCIGQLLQLNPFVLLIIARLINGLIFLFAGYWMIKKIPFGKSVTLVYLLNPMLIHQQASCSADAITNVFALSFTVMIVYVYFSSKVTKYHIAALILLFLSVAVVKYAYVTLGLLFFLFLPRLKNRRLRVGIVVSFITICFLSLVYLIITQSDKPTTIGYMLDLMSNPVNCIFVVGNTLVDYLIVWIETFAASSLGSFTISTWAPLKWFYYAILLMTIFVAAKKEHFSFTLDGKIVFVITTLVSSLLLILAFREWSIVVHSLYNSITGVQGRYFIPIAILLLLAAFNHNKIIVRPSSNILYASYCAFFLLFCVLHIIRHFV